MYTDWQSDLANSLDSIHSNANSTVCSGTARGIVNLSNWEFTMDALTKQVIHSNANLVIPTLMEYLAMPLDSNTPSPSELNGHKFNSLLPNISNSKHSDVLAQHHDAQLQHGTRGCTLPKLPVGSKVGYRNHVTDKFDVGIVSARDARSYIHTEHGTHVSKNHVDLKQPDAPFEQKTETQSVSNFAKSNNAPTIVPSSTNVKCAAQAKLILKGVEVSSKSNSMYTTHSGLISRPAKRLITQM